MFIRTIALVILMALGAGAQEAVGHYELAGSSLDVYADRGGWRLVARDGSTRESVSARLAPSDAREVYAAWLVSAHTGCSSVRLPGRVTVEVTSGRTQLWLAVAGESAVVYVTPATVAALERTLRPLALWPSATTGWHSSRSGSSTARSKFAADRAAPTCVWR